MWPVWLYKLIHDWIKKKAHKLERWKNKMFKQEIGITEKAKKQEGIAVAVM